jgi:predicted alpha/beta hydrolase
VCRTTKNFISTFVLTPSGLSLNAVKRSNWNLWVRMTHSYQANTRWVFELMVRAFDSRQIPAIFLKSLDDLFAVHANCTDLVGISNTKFIRVVEELTSIP